MGFHNSYSNRKDARRSRAIRKGCRPIGGCSWCLSNKAHRFHKQLLRAVDEDFIDGREIRPRRKFLAR